MNVFIVITKNRVYDDLDADIVGVFSELNKAKECLKDDWDDAWGSPILGDYGRNSPELEVKKDDVSFSIKRKRDGKILCATYIEEQYVHGEKGDR